MSEENELIAKKHVERAFLPKNTDGGDMVATSRSIIIGIITAALNEKETAQSARVAALKEIIAIALPWVERCPSDGLVAQKQAILAKMQAVFTEAAPLTEESEEELAEKIAYAWYPAAKDNPDGIAGEQFQKLRQFALEALRGRIKGKG